MSDKNIEIYHVSVSECFHGCGTPLVRIEAIHEKAGMIRISCEASAEIDTGEIRLKVHTDCPKKESSCQV